MTRNTLHLGTLRGIAIGVHVSWLIAFVLVTWSIAMGFVPQVLPHVDPLEAWVIGAIAAFLLFVSVLVHELAHSFVAISRGLPVHSITLFLFGGVSNLTAEPKDPRTEFLIAIVGPLTSFAIAGVVLLLTSIPVNERIAVVMGYLIVVNILLGAFNLIPGFPLDGGRVFRSIVWKATGSVRRATDAAAAVGQLAGFGFVAWGVLRVFDGDLLGGLWTAAIGLFLQNAAGSSVKQVALDQRLSSVRVRDAFTPEEAGAAPGLTIDQLIEEHILGRKRRAVLVTEHDRLLGIVTIGDLQKVPPGARGRVTVREVMTPAHRLVTTSPNANLREAAGILAQREFDQLPVVEDDHVLGAVTRADIMREFDTREALAIGDRSATGRHRAGTRPQAADA